MDSIGGESRFSGEFIAGLDFVLRFLGEFWHLFEKQPHPSTNFEGLFEDVHK